MLTKLLSLALVVLVAVTSSKADNARLQELCQKYDCPPFTSQSIGEPSENSEERTFPGDTTWVETSSQPPNRRRGMFMKLYRYIRGENQAGSKTKMTIPVLLKFERTSGNQKTKTMSFYMKNSNPPQPTNTDVSLRVMQAGKIFYVRTFTTTRGQGRPNYRKHLNDLKTTLDRLGLAYKPNIHYNVGYNSPWQYPKTSEVWMEKL